MHLKKKIFVLKFFLSITIIVYILYNYIDVDELFLSFLNINIFIFSLTVTLLGIIRFTVAYQTKIALLPFRIYFPTYHIFKVHLIATLYGSISFGGIVFGGVSWYLLSKDNGRRAEVASVLVYLKILNLMTLLPFALTGIYFEPQLKSYHLETYIFVLSLLLVFMLFPFFICPIAKLLESSLNSLILLMPVESVSKRLLEMNHNVWNATHITGKIPVFLQIKIITIAFICQILGIIAMYLSLITVSIEVPIFTATWLAALLTLISMLPITIAGIGVRDLSLIFILNKFYSIPPEFAILLSTLLLFVNVIFFGAILGGYYAMTFTSGHK